MMSSLSSSHSNAFVNTLQTNIKLALVGAIQLCWLVGDVKNSHVFLQAEYEPQLKDGSRSSRQKKQKLPKPPLQALFVAHIEE